jgi:hypothetical protein
MNSMVSDRAIQKDCSEEDQIYLGNLKSLLAKRNYELLYQTKQNFSFRIKKSNTDVRL